MNIIQVNELVNRGFKIENLEAYEGTVTLLLESPDGYRHRGSGSDVSEAFLCALIAMVVKLEYYLKEAERERDMYRDGLRPVFDAKTPKVE